MSTRSDNTTADFRRATSSDQRALLGLIRRVAVRVTSRTFWQSVGVLLLDSTTPETVEAEVFSGIGFYSRPKAGRRAEAILAHPGGTADNAVIVATRDEDTRRDMADLDEDETAMFNTQAGVFVEDDGKVRVRTKAGTAHTLATNDDLNALRAWAVAQFSGVGHLHATTCGAGAGTTTAITPFSPPTLPATPYVGTQVLKGQ